jgi:hypothetical protein
MKMSYLLDGFGSLWEEPVPKSSQSVVFAKKKCHSGSIWEPLRGATPKACKIYWFYLFILKGKTIILEALGRLRKGTVPKSPKSVDFERKTSIFDGFGCLWEESVPRSPRFVFLKGKRLILERFGSRWEKPLAKASKSIDFEMKNDYFEKIEKPLRRASPKASKICWFWKENDHFRRIWKHLRGAPLSKPSKSIDFQNKNVHLERIWINTYGFVKLYFLLKGLSLKERFLPFTLYFLSLLPASS